MSGASRSIEFTLRDDSLPLDDLTRLEVAAELALEESERLLREAAWLQRRVEYLAGYDPPVYSGQRPH